MENGGVAPSISNLSAGYRQALSFTPQPLYTFGNHFIMAPEPVREQWREVLQPLVTLESRLCIPLPAISIPSELARLQLQNTYSISTIAHA
jgi:hypothetical protein